MGKETQSGLIAFYETGDYKQYTDYFLDRQLGRLKEVKDVIWHFKKQSGCMKFMQPDFFLIHLLAGNIRLVLFSFIHAVLYNDGVTVDGNNGKGVSHLVLIIYDDLVARNLVGVGGGTGRPCLGVCIVISDVARSVALEEHACGIVGSFGDVLVYLNEILIFRVIVPPSRYVGSLPDSHDVVLDTFRRYRIAVVGRRTSGE